MQRLHKASLYLLFILLHFSLLHAQDLPYRIESPEKLPNGDKFAFWANETSYSKTYYVDVQNPKASDDNPGTKAKPFQSINQAAQVAKPGKRILIAEGVYREVIRPKQGGTDAAHMISYEAMPEAKVVIKGSIELEPKKWQSKQGIYKIKKVKDKEGNSLSKILLYDLKGIDFQGYNPFAMMNILHDRSWLQHRQKINMSPFFLKRGRLFMDGKPLQQVETVMDLGKDTQRYFISHDGLKLFLHVPASFEPAEHLIEAAIRESVFEPQSFYQGYIQLKGLHFEQVANGFPVPQKGMVSAMRGHHWLIEDCRFYQANALGLDLGYQYWKAPKPDSLPSGGHIVRSCTFEQCGVGGIAGMWADDYLIESNLFKDIGYHIAEPAFESGAIKLHNAKSCLIRQNLFQDITRAPGLWLDYSCKNNRVSMNAFSNISTSRGGVFIEVSQYPHLVDHNFFHGLESGYWLSGDPGAGGNALYTDGSDYITFRNNLCMDIENTGFGAYLNADRKVEGRGGTMRRCTLENNIFHRCQKWSLDLPNTDHSTASNIYSRVPAGHIHLRAPEEVYLDVEAWQTFWDKGTNSVEQKLELEFDPETLVLSIQGDKSLKKTGPFKMEYTNFSFSVDPRNK